MRSPRSAVALGALLAGLGVAACDAIVGIEPFTAASTQEGGASNQHHDAGGDHDAAPQHDATIAADATDATTPAVDADNDAGREAGHDASTHDADAAGSGSDASDARKPDARVDASIDASLEDAGVDGGPLLCQGNPDAALTEAGCDDGPPHACPDELIGIACGQLSPGDLVVAGGFVYWTNSVNGLSGGSVVRASLTTGVVTTIASGQDRPASIAVDSVNAYWTNLGGSTTASTLVKGPIGGGTLTTLDTRPVGNGQLVGVAVDVTNVYTTDITAGQVRRVAIAGGAVSTLVTGLAKPAGIAVDGTNVYWATEAGPVSIYSLPKVTNPPAMPTPADGGSPLQALASGPPGTTATYASHLVVDPNNVYWTNEIGGSAGVVLKVAKTGGVVSTLATLQNYPGAIATDGTNLYWTTSVNETPTGTNGTLLSVPLAGGVPTTLAINMRLPTGVAVSDSTTATDVFFVTAPAPNGVVAGNIWELVVPK